MALAHKNCQRRRASGYQSTDLGRSSIKCVPKLCQSSRFWDISMGAFTKPGTIWFLSPITTRSNCANITFWACPTQQMMVRPIGELVKYQLLFFKTLLLWKTSQAAPFSPIWKADTKYMYSRLQNEVPPAWCAGVPFSTTVTGYVGCG